MNTWVGTGNLTDDPKVTEKTTKFSIANNTGYGEYKNVNFIPVTTFKKTAEACGKYLSKGSKVLIRGELRQNRWEHEGKKYDRLEIIAEEVEFLSTRKKSDEAQAAEEVGDDKPPF
jgi:single-strand DNA-binding protein